MREVRRLVAAEHVLVNGMPAIAVNQIVDQFSRVKVSGVLLPHDTALYWMVNKPSGVVSATRDSRHTTVIDLIDDERRHDLHIVGRLDFNSTGLVLLSNDGHWSRRISMPGSALAKVYRVSLQNPVTDECVRAFETGIYFAHEGITTLPAHIHRLGPREVEVTIFEGKYHQIKRMFGRFNNRVLSLHRHSVGALQLDAALQAGDSRSLTEAERQDLQCAQSPGAVHLPSLSAST